VRFWWAAKPPLWTLPLAPVSLLYGAGAGLVRARARPLRLSVPVISIGNLTVGGAGKTPVTLWLSQRLVARGRKPAVLSRGYGRTSQEPLRVTPQTDARLCGDEPLLLARHGLDVWVAARRSSIAPQAIAAGADVLLLDDGLQHHALARDLDVVVADASNPLGNGALLPRGPLREGVSSLRRVRRGLLWLTRCDLPRSPRTAQLASLGLPLVESRYAATRDLRGRRVFLFAGIARPDSFEVLARELGADVVGARWFRDHHWYSDADLTSLRAQAAGAELLTTEKDLVRIAQPEGISALPIELQVSAGEAAIDRLLAEVAS
jgi:tetraacyldisaccharide 4'-kinase